MTDNAKDGIELPRVEDVPGILQGALAQIRFAREYTLELLNATPPELWYETPADLPTHVAWQAGHLAYSQYGLLMFRIRGRTPDDLDLVPGTFRKRFGRGTTPPKTADGNPTPQELLQRLQTIHETGLAELSSITPQTLLEPIDMPYAGYPCKLGAVLFCPLHEQIHAGQIGLLRRAHGLESIR